MKNLVGAFKNPDGSPVANGKLYLKLSQDAVVPGGFQTCSQAVVIALDATGSVPAGTQVVANDELSPSGTYYTMSVTAPGGGTAYGPEKVQLTGASPINLSGIVPSAGNGVVQANAVITNPSVQQTINGQNLVLEGANLGLSGAGSTSGDTWVNRPAAGTVGVGTTSGATDGTLKAATVNATTGFQVNGAATSAHVLRGNGTNFVDSALAAADLSNGVTGSGAVALATSPTLVTPNIGAATGTSLTVGNGGVGTPSLTFSGSTTSGFAYAAGTTPYSQNNGVIGVSFPAPSTHLPSNGAYGWTATFDSTVAADTGLSRTAAATVAVGNGTAGDITGTLKAATLSIPTTSNTLPATITNDGAGSIVLTSNSLKQLALATTGLFLTPGLTLNLQGSVSGATSLGAAATASGTLTLPAATDTLVGKATTDTLTNKTINSFIGTAKTLNSIRFAENFSGADCGAKINAADADLGATPGEIWVSQAAGTTISTAVSLSANHVLRFIQGGTYTCSAAFTLGQGSGIIGSAAGGNLTPTVLQAAASSNLAALVNLGDQSSISHITLDGNKTNNPTGGVGIFINLHQQTKLERVLVQNFKSHGVSVASSLSGDEATVPVFSDCLIFSNDGDGLRSQNTSDGFMSEVQFEQNGLGGNPAAAVTVNTSGTTVTWVSGSKWSTDSSLVGTFVRINGSLFLVSAIASTTSFTVTASPGTLTGVALNWGNGAELSDSPGWRFEHCDFGGNANNGLLLYGSDAGRGSGQQIVTGNQFGGQRAVDIEEIGFGTAAYVAVNNTYTANMFLGSTIRTPNTYSAIRLQDFQDDVIVANVFRPANTKYGVEFTESSSGRSQRSVLVGNSFIAGFGTAAWASNTANFGQAIASFANAEGTTTSSTFGSGAGSIKFQGGILNSGTGLQHVRASGCTTAAAVNSRCTTTINWPATWNDTNYTATCSVGSVTNPVFVAWTGGISTTQIQVVLENPPDSAAAATGTVHCIGIHD